MTTEPRFGPATFFMIGGFVVWAAHFLLIYSFTGLVCKRPAWAMTEIAGLRLSSAGTLFLTLLALAALAIIARSAGLAGPASDYGGQVTPSGFPRYLALGSAGLAAIAIIWEGLIPVFLVPACG